MRSSMSENDSAVSADDMPVLTGYDRSVIARARKLADVHTAGDVRRHAGTEDLTMAYAECFGEAQALLAELAVMAERLGDAR